MDFSDIKLGNEYWCVFKVSVIDPAKIEQPEFLMHIAKGRVLSKGTQLTDDKNVLLFVEVAGERIRSDHIFDNPLLAIDKLEEMMHEMSTALNPTSV